MRRMRIHTSYVSNTIITVNKGFVKCFVVFADKLT